MTATPYSYVITGGVANTRVHVEEDGDLAGLAKTQPVQLDVTSIEYHNADKRTRTAIKKQLPYFVGGVIKGKRDDGNVTARTLITLDIERHEKQTTEPPQPQEIAEKLEELGAEGWVYTSVSHTPKSPRYRVVLPLGKQLEVDGIEDAQETLKATTISAAEKLGIGEWCTPESYVLSQAMYLPAKLKGGKFFSAVTEGRAWGVKQGSKRERGQPADIPDERPDPVLHAIKAAGLYLGENPKHKGMHYITCPMLDEHEQENETQTCYYEAHYDGNPRPAVKCFDTAPDHDGHYHLTFKTLVRWLKDNGHLTQEEQDAAGVLDDYDIFDTKASIGRLLDSTPAPRAWAIDRFAPTGKVTVLAGPGGVSKSMLMLHVLVHAALGQDWGGFKVDEPLRSLYVSYEDDTQELHKRIHTLAEALRDQDAGTFDLLYDVSGSINANMRVFAADDDATAWLLLTKPDKWEQPARTERIEWLVGYLKAKSIKLLVLDPAVYTHQLEENNIADMATYMQTLTYIAKQAQCAVVVLHHVNKQTGWLTLNDVNQSSLRGASSFADNARSVGMVVNMPHKDAEQFGIAEEDVKRFLVFKHVKHNYSAPMEQLIYERKAGALVPRPDVLKMGSAELAEARDAAKVEAAARHAEAWAGRVLQVLADHSGPITTNQIAGALNVTAKTRLKPVLDYCEMQDWIDVEDGANRSHLHSLTKLGRVYLRTLNK